MRAFDLRAGARVQESRDEVAQAKAQSRVAYGKAKAAGGLATALADRVWSDTLLSAEGQRPGARAEMYTRTTSLFALLTDRQSWPRRWFFPLRTPRRSAILPT